MASSLISGIYPPLVNTYNPTFVNSEKNFKIYFAISEINNLKEIKEAHVVLSDAQTGLSIIKDISKILIKTIYKDEEIETDYKYYIEINKENDLLEDSLKPEKIYKAQLRFSKVVYNGNKKDYLSFFERNKTEFSEWSILTIIRSVYKPIWDIAGLSENEIQTVSDYFIPFFGQFRYELKDGDKVPDDYLLSYTISLISGNDVLDVIEKDSVDRRLSQDVGYIPINETFYYLLDSENDYTIKLDYKTAFGYQDTLFYDFYYDEKMNNQLNDISIEVDYSTSNNENVKKKYLKPDDQNGRIFINISTKALDYFDFDIANNYNKVIYIYRTDASSNFKKFDLVHRVKVLKGYDFNYQFCDKTAESGIFYKYAARQKGKYKDEIIWGKTVFTEIPVMQYLEDMFLIGDNKILKIALDPQINTYGYQVKEAVTDTIGGKYPIINRGGNKEYRKFNISGTICSIDNILNETDIKDATSEIKTVYTDRGENLFASRDMIYNNITEELYDRYNQDWNINYWNDVNFERFFREKVLEFLYDGNVKLFRSATEGNIMVRLTGISLSANQSLGRFIYGFQATAIEVMDYTIENCDIYDIQNIGYKMRSEIVLEASKVYRKTVYNPTYLNDVSNLNTKLLFKEKVVIDRDEGGDDL